MAPEPLHPHDPEATAPATKKRSRRRYAVVAVLLLALGAIGVAVVTAELSRRAQERHEARVASSEAVADSLLQIVEAHFEEVPLLDASTRQTLRRYLNEEHIAMAQHLGTRFTDRAQADRLMEEGQMVHIEDTFFYEVAPMNYGVPIVLSETKRLLALIGLRFQQRLAEQGLPPYRFRITSATRTADDQARLRGGNINAATDVSSHEFGTTLDLHYGVFDFPKEALQTLPVDTTNLYPDLVRERLAEGFQELAEDYHRRLQGVLGRTVGALQEEGLLYAIYERRQPVYHLTLAERVEPERVAAVAAAVLPILPFRQTPVDSVDVASWGEPRTSLAALEAER